jgi:hypothetical protein
MWRDDGGESRGEAVGKGVIADSQVEGEVVVDEGSV